MNGPRVSRACADKRDWELLLVDETIAQSYASDAPQRIRYLHHPGHVNRGMSRSRNLEIEAVLPASARLAIARAALDCRVRLLRKLATAAAREIWGR
jgi:hypothetical protein